ncbi:hypothetical protein [uncultured Sphingomonas sp.]|uniref:hypothetical protein n=1 Tax=uncultured Sphingomonas sp. TaxID=158754 RepID=UPI0035CBC950
MTRARIDLTDFDETPPKKDEAKLREISDDAGFPSRPAVPAAPPSAARAPSGTFQRPARQTGNRHIPINVRVDPETAERLYALRDLHQNRKRALADVIEEATQLLYDQQIGGKQA